MNIHERFTLGTACLVLGAYITSSALAADSDTGSHLVVAQVSTFRNSHGFLGCRLFRSAEGFPESAQDAVEIRVPVAGTTTRCEFRNISPGSYAIAVMHDENDNRKLDKNFLGVPTEGYGVSNNKTYAMSSPKWVESTFSVAEQDVVLTINLRY